MVAPVIPPAAFSRRTVACRGGFTLVELLTVILIIAILVALLVPAIFGAVRRTRDAALTAEINSVAAALEEFRLEFGDYPPSRIFLSEDGFFPTGSDVLVAGDIIGVTTGADTNVGILAQRSLSIMQKFFKDVRFSTTSPIYAADPANPGATFLDFNGNGVLDPPYVLRGDECLTFFLGGIPLQDLTIGQPDSVIGMSGFARGANPFVSANINPNRTEAFFDFTADRLADIDFNQAFILDPSFNDGIPSFIDPYSPNRTSETDRVPYAYFVPTANGLYNPHDCDFFRAEEDPNATGFVPRLQIDINTYTSSFPPNPYYSSALQPSSAAVALPNQNQLPVFLRPQTYQIISAGADRAFGPGGTYRPDDNTKLPLNTAAFGSPAEFQAASDARQLGTDNLSNFSTGQLD